MTRRKFFQKMAKAGAAIIIGGVWLTKKAVPRRFVRASAAEKYPGVLKPLQNISRQSKWSG
jgi:hypothetical protein